MVAWLFKFRRTVLVHRRLVAALCAAVASYLALTTLQPKPVDTESLWVATRSLAAGHRLVEADLEQAAFLPNTAPPDALPKGALVGQTLASPVAQGEPISPVRLLGTALTRAYPGSVATPVRLGDAAVVDLIKPGDVVDLVLADPTGRAEPRVVVAGARVIAVPPAKRDAVGAPDGALVVFAVQPEVSASAAAAAVNGFVTVVWH